MSYIDAINQTAAESMQTESKKKQPDNGIMGKEDFLTLLVTQLKNQDPLNPDEPTEFTAQLAQFSSLEQLFNLNESMGNVADSVANSQKFSALSLMGKEVAYADSEFAFSGDPVRIGYSLDGEAADITLRLEHNGDLVDTIEGADVGAGDHYLTWDGILDSGAMAPVGKYSIVIEAAAADGSVAVAPLVRSEVTGVDLSGEGGGLLFTTAGEVRISELKGVYDVGAPIKDTSSDGWSTVQWGGNPSENSDDRDRTWWTKIHGGDYPHWHRKFPLPDWVDDAPQRLQFEFSDGSTFTVPDSTHMTMNPDGPKYVPEEDGEGDPRKQHPKIAAELDAEPLWVRVRAF